MSLSVSTMDESGYPSFRNIDKKDFLQVLQWKPGEYKVSVEQGVSWFGVTNFALSQY